MAKGITIACVGILVWLFGMLILGTLLGCPDYREAKQGVKNTVCLKYQQIIV